MKRQTVRKIIQVLATLGYNCNISGFFKGGIFKGDTKAVCVPGLNCYSCPGAVGSCPIGALQSVISGNKSGFSFYVAGILIFFGAIFGRFICGFLCPFGLIQELLYKISVPKIKVPKKPDKLLRYLKYVVLVLFVLVLPAVLVNEFGIGSPYFCKWLCPVGTLEGGIPLLLLNEGLRAMAGKNFYWKLSLTFVLLALSTTIYRPFCKYLCPLGAVYAFFNKVSFFRMQVNEEKCIGCGKCEKTCPMGVEVLKDINSTECIRCGKCKDVCPCGAIEGGAETRVLKKQKSVER
ncbi:MAG: 4Fe-4S binding protein [Oscillospiraceae bacterium]|nr:4Fe-4S binding protein [Oscillospiraceae bacterium]MBQ9939426.1 4Fe-4S binding protein [Oscillospiraceae bacterium]